MKPYKGTITVRENIAPLIELGAGFDANLTARENIFLNGAVLGHSKKEMQEHFEEIVDFAEIRKFLDSPIKNYSSGMKARLGFSVATMVKPDILIVDEVLSVGDYKFKQKCQKNVWRRCFLQEPLFCSFPTALTRLKNCVTMRCGWIMERW